MSIKPISALQRVLRTVGFNQAARFLNDVRRIGITNSPTIRRDPYEIFDTSRGLFLLATKGAMRQKIGKPLTLVDVYYDSNAFAVYIQSGYWHCHQIIAKLIANDKVYTEKNLKILDIGCHQGNLTEEIQKHFPLFKGIESYCGIDLSQDAIRIARSLHPQHTFIEGNALSEETYQMVPQDNNVVVCSGVCDFLSPRDIKNLLMAINRKLSREDDAQVFINYQTSVAHYGVSQPVKARMANRDKFTEDGIACYKDNTKDCPPMYTYDSQEFNKLVESCGFEIVKENSQSDTSTLTAVYDIVCLRKKR